MRIASTRRLFLPALLALAAVTAGCSNDETDPDPGHAAPESARLFVNGQDVTNDLTLTAGQPTTVEIRFYDANDQAVAGIEDEHFATLTFTPSTLATTTDVSGHRFQKVVTPQGTAGTGTSMVGYGHAADADEDSFGPFSVTVE